MKFVINIPWSIVPHEEKHTILYLMENTVLYNEYEGENKFQN